MNFSVSSARSSYPKSSSRSITTLLGRASERRAELILLSALALNVLEGAIRKWVIGSGSNQLSYLAYFSKDIIFAALLLLPAKKVSSPALECFRRWLFPGCILIGLGALLSSIKGFNPVGAVLTIRALILLPLLAFYVVPRITNDKGDSLQSAIWLLAVLTAGNFVLGAIQNSLSADHMLNRYATDGADIVELQSGVRATGTFAYITGMGIISTVGIWTGLMLFNISRNVWQQMAALTVVASGFGCGLAAVSRGSILVGLGIVFIWLLYSGASSLLNFRNLIACALFILLAFYFGVSSKFFELRDGMLERHETAGDTIEGRTFGQVHEAIEALDTAPFGRGFGTEQIGGNYYSSGEMKFTTYENQLPRLVLETGITGLLGFLLVCAGAILSLQIAKRDAATRSRRAILLTTQLMLLPLFYINVVFNHTASTFVWIIFAVVISAQYSGKNVGYRWHRVMAG
jgi:O-Antigen ligase